VPGRERLAIRPLAGIAGLALVWRIVYVLVWGHDPLIFGDGLYYHLQANALADGRGFIDPIKFAYLQGAHPSAAHPPLFSLVLFAVTRGGRALGFGSFDTTLVHQLTCAAVSTIAVVVVGLVACRVGGARVGLIAAALAAVYPPLWTSDALVMSESLYVLTIALVLLAFYALFERPAYWRAAVCGLAIGAATLTRSEGLLLLPILGIPLLRSRFDRSVGRRFVTLGIVAIVTALICAPWVVRNVRTFHRSVALSENIDSVVAGANCATTYHGSRIGSWDVTCNPVPQLNGDESDLGAAQLERGLKYAKQHAQRVPLVVAARVGRTFLVFQPLADSVESGRAAWTQWATLVTFVPTTVLAIIGLISLRRRRIAIGPLVAMGVLVVATSALTYGISRFRVPWDVASVIAAAAGIAHLLPPSKSTLDLTPGNGALTGEMVE
jgi:4-amino-4-deoxy-L-arabinose transferase-like glycosyltransferase